MESEEAKAPLQGNYPLTVAFVLLALCPDLFWSTSMPLLRMQIAHALHVPVSALGLGEIFSNAGWAFGAVLAADLAQRFHNYKLNLIYEGVFIVGSIIGALAPSAAWFDAARILQGTATGMLLVSSLPPLIRNFGVGKLSATVAFTDLGLFGADAAGPLIGGYVALTATWRWFFAASALLGLLALILIWLVVQRSPGYNPDQRFDYKAIALAAAAAGLAFYGVGRLTTLSWTSPSVWVPATLGVICTLVLILYQYHARDALMPVKPLSTTYPLVGILVGVLAGTAYTAQLELIFLFLRRIRGLPPLGIGLVLWPGLGMALTGAVLFGKLFPTRYVLLLPLFGLLALLASAWLLTRTTLQTGTGEFLWIAGLLGFGESVTVSPGLFMAGLSVRPRLVGRAFALVELLRLAGAFAFVPAFTYFAMAYGSAPERLMLGLHAVYWVILIGIVGVMVFASAIFFAGGASLHPPDLAAYIERNEEGIESPPFGEAVARGELGPAVARGELGPAVARGELGPAVARGLGSAFGRGDDPKSPSEEERDAGPVDGGSSRDGATEEGERDDRRPERDADSPAAPISR